MGGKSKDPGKQTITKDDKAKSKAGKPGEQLSEEELDKASGGRARVVVNFVKIAGPSWVNLMPYRKAGWAAEPKRKGSLADLHKELAAEAADDE